MKRHIYQQVDYNLWATQKIVSFLENIQPDLFESPIDNSFPTLKDTILHIYAAEETWVKRMNGTPPSVWPATSFRGNAQEALNAWQTASSNLKAYVDQHTEQALLAEISYTSFEGIQLTNSKEKILYHVINHSSYHRGQIVTISKQLMLKGAPSTDLFYYYNTGA